MKLEIIDNPTSLTCFMRGARYFCYKCSVKKGKLIELRDMKIRIDGQKTYVILNHHHKEYMKESHEFSKKNRIKTEHRWSFAAFIEEDS